MRRALAWLLSLSTLWSALPMATAAAQGAALPEATASGDDPLADLLDERALKATRNPVVASFLAGEGAALVPEELRERALVQLRGALKGQTDFMGLMLSGVGGVMGSDTMKKQQEWASRQSTGKMLAGAYLGIGPAAPPGPAGDQMQREMQQALTDPWVRGIEAAAALERLGDANAAARFYVQCLAFLPEAWVPEACLQGILDLGPERAETLLRWMLAEAESITEAPAGGMNVAMPSLDPAAAGKKPRKGDPLPGTIQVRNAALAGLGGLIGGGGLPAERSAAALQELLAYSQGKSNELYFRGAAAGLGRSRDPRAVDPLRRLAKWRQDPDAKQVALRALAVGFGDEAARKQLRQELDDSDPQEQLRAAQALYETGDAAAFDWAVDVITQRRSTDSKKADIRAQVVRDLVELGGERSKVVLARVLVEGPGNDWLVAWTQVALLELGDRAQLPQVEAALAKEDWRLDPRGFRSIWRAISPFLQAAAGILMTGGIGALTALQQIRKAVQLVGNFAAGERSRYLSKVDARQGATAQLRWQAAEAIAAAQPKNAVALLRDLLADEAPPVRLSAALALAEIEDPQALDGLVSAFALDYGAENGVSRTPEVRAALLRAAWLRDAEAPASREMARLATTDPDGAVRFIGWAILRPAS
ncbi:MAG: HEAT repeat domain-containing protein [Thermoanaerobaculia bacterium]